MSDTNEPKEAPASEANSDPNRQSALADELRELGQQLEQAFRTAIESDRFKTMQRDLLAGMRELGVQMQNAAQRIQQDPNVHNMAVKGQQAVKQAQDSPAVRDFQEMMTRGIAQLNEQLAAFVARQREQNDTAAPPTKSQSVPIEQEPNTSETTRLDPPAS
jgi:glutamate-1-semialdehyde aminotransferase